MSIVIALIILFIAIPLLIGAIYLIIHLGAIFNAAQRPPHQDAGNYELSTGHEVRPELEHPAETHSSYD